MSLSPQYNASPYPATRNRRFRFPNVYPCVRPSIGYDSSLRGANTVQHVCSTESLLYHFLIITSLLYDADQSSPPVGNENKKYLLRDVVGFMMP